MAKAVLSASRRGMLSILAVAPVAALSFPVHAQTDRTPWLAAVAKRDRVDAAWEDFLRGPYETAERAGASMAELDALWDDFGSRHHDAERAMMEMPAPDIFALVEKLKVASLNDWNLPDGYGDYILADAIRFAGLEAHHV